MTAKAAPDHFPYAHRTMAQVMEAEDRERARQAERRSPYREYAREIVR